ncbi:MAG TPA: type I restriction enzyme HsdR N-terminal domain-containing protein [Opitutaceae bacterium]|nr:type I restriction enzyme HsdR N-terminal domain-containing protein [Opitutaceae bacterium]
MPTIPRKAEDRIVAGIKRFQPILASAKSRDVNESDTVLIITDVLADVFGYEKYSEITSEMAIRGTYCDLAIKLDGKVQVLIEVKAIGLELKANHLKQAVDYAANQGIEWVVLTNGNVWRIYRVIFAKPIDSEMIAEFMFPELDVKRAEHMELVFLLSKEGWAKSAIGEFESRKQALNRFFIGAVVLSEPVLSVIRRELRRVTPDVKVEVEQICAVLSNEVLKREVIEGEKFAEAKKIINRAASKMLREVRDHEPELPPPAQDGPCDLPPVTS